MDTIDYIKMYSILYSDELSVIVLGYLIPASIGVSGYVLKGTIVACKCIMKNLDLVAQQDRASDS